MAKLIYNQPGVQTKQMEHRLIDKKKNKQKRILKILLGINVALLLYVIIREGYLIYG